MNASSPFENETPEALTSNWLDSDPPSCSSSGSTEPENREKPWWQANFNNSYRIKEIQILPNNRDAARGLGNTKIKIDDNKLCGSVEGEPENGKWVTVRCGGGGVSGSKIELQKVSDEYNLVFCGIKVYGYLQKEEEE